MINTDKIEVALCDTEQIAKVYQQVRLRIWLEQDNLRTGGTNNMSGIKRENGQPTQSFVFDFCLITWFIPNKFYTFFLLLTRGCNTEEGVLEIIDIIVEFEDFRRCEHHLILIHD